MYARLVMSSLVLLVSGFCLGQENQAKKKDDLDLLQGEWRLIHSKIGTIEYKAENGGTLTLIVKGDEWKQLKLPKCKIKIAAAKSPKQIDLTGNVRVGIESTRAGIYKIEGDTLTVCSGVTAAVERPTEFKDVPRSVVLQVFKRVEKK